MNRYKNDKADETRIQVNTGGANVADYCLQNHVAALGGWQGTCYGAFNFRYHFDIKQGCRISKYC